MGNETFYWDGLGDFKICILSSLFVCTELTQDMGNEILIQLSYIQISVCSAIIYLLWMDGWIDGWMIGWIDDGRMDGRMDGWIVG